MGPRFNIKYRTAAESALHNCYRATLELTKEAHLASVAISPINSVRRGYPPEAGAHMALRTHVLRPPLRRLGRPGRRPSLDRGLMTRRSHPERNGYAPRTHPHPHMRTGTIRRFLEHFGDGLDAVVLCPTDEVDIKAYETLLPQYFPRSAAEIEYSRKYLPEDIGAGRACHRQHLHDRASGGPEALIRTSSGRDAGLGPARPSRQRVW